MTKIKIQQEIDRIEKERNKIFRIFSSEEQEIIRKILEKTDRILNLKNLLLMIDRRN